MLQTHIVMPARFIPIKVPTAHLIMKPVAIFRHSPTEGPGYFASFLDRHHIPWQLIALDAGEAVPTIPDAFAGLCFMGGPMSVNDDLPWIPSVLELIRQAVAADIPVIGHCLGGQLMSKALGGIVSRNPVKEIGWGRVSPSDAPVAQQWLGDTPGFDAFHWHGETFALPAGATRILGSQHCTNQAFVMGKHLGMQCHVEMTEEMIRTWNTQWADEITDPANIPSAVQTPEQQFAQLEANLPAMRAIADRLYTRWIAGLREA